MRLEAKRHGRSWSVEEIALGFVGDVGELPSLVQAASGVRDIPDWRSRLGHELADCLWSILVLADQLEMDIERAFTDTRAQAQAPRSFAGWRQWVASLTQHEG